ncbi:MAG TPA: DEAD/DEAH box helicase, partial [Rectinemataceae bacterium]|nr:DEAD/DEAH box helicase [Rectinemataceae bacterium]
VLTLLGGSPLSRQEAALKKKPHIVVGTPGRTADLVRMRFLKLANLNYLVLDEADRLFSQEYRESVASIAEASPPNCCKVLASATITPSTRKQAKAFLKSPESLDLLEEGVLSRDIEHWVFYVEQRKRIDFIRKLEAVLHPAKCLVFASTGDMVVKTAEHLAEIGLPADSILSKQEKEHRRVAIERFENGSLRYLVTTDLGARGLDIAGITHIISLDFPEDGSGYIHRAGRTARAGEKGVSIVLGDGWDIRNASKVAVERNFVFRTKVLAAGAILEPPVEDFFAIVEAGEAEKREFRMNRRSGAGKPRNNE